MNQDSPSLIFVWNSLACLQNLTEGSKAQVSQFREWVANSRKQDFLIPESQFSICSTPSYCEN